MSELKLLRDYFTILEHCRDPDEVFREKPVEKEFAWLWVLKLCLDIYKGPEAMRLRNTYLLELSQCIDNGEMSPMFLRSPPEGNLPPFGGSSNIKVDKKEVVREMQAAAAECVPLVSPRNYHTHMSTKIFDDNRGGCAVLAVSLGDPRDGPLWLQMGSQAPYRSCQSPSAQDECESTDVDDGQDMDVNVRFGEFCLNAVVNELSGQAMPGDCPELEQQLKKYAEFIQNYPTGERAKLMDGIKLRTFLLLNLQTNLVKALRSV